MKKEHKLMNKKYIPFYSAENRTKVMIMSKKGNFSFKHKLQNYQRASNVMSIFYQRINYAAFLHIL